MDASKELSLEEYFVYKEDSNGDVDIETCPAIKRASYFMQSEYREELVQYSIFDSKQKDPLRKQVDEILSKKAKTKEEDRAFGSMMGMVVGDALGAPMEFKRVQYGVITITDMVDATSFSLQAGQWTDDASMGLCIADSLLKHPNFCPSDLKLRFFNWWTFGYNNAFRFDEKRLYKGSVGLGGNISMSLSEFQRKGTTFTKAGDKNTSGNGSVMRNGAIAVRFHDDYTKCLEIAGKQSLLTHQGEEAAECCRLMAHLVYHAIHGDGTVKSLLTLISFDTKLPSVQNLINSESDSDFNWKSKDFKYNTKRAIQQPTYVGSYCMDAVSMALHCIWTTDTFASAMLKSANMAGDADSVTAVCGQIAGAIYGLSAFPTKWLDKVHKWDKKDTLLKAYKLYHKAW